MIRATGFIALATLVLGVAAPSTPPATHVVKMNPNRFVPAEIRARAGDTIRFVNGNGGPHNVRFFDDSVPAHARPLIAAAMPGGTDKVGPMSGPLLMIYEQTYTMVVPKLSDGRYAFDCLLHAGMQGALVVQRD